jgi:hypothetical protein
MGKYALTIAALARNLSADDDTGLHVLNYPVADDDVLKKGRCPCARAEDALNEHIARASTGLTFLK